MSLRRTNNLIKLEAKIKTEMDSVLYQEELLWFERSREQWITSGDRSTKYYHAATKIHKATSGVHAIMNDQGMMETDYNKIHDIVSKYFANLFTNNKKCNQVKLSNIGFPAFNDHMVSTFCREVTKEEVRVALFDMSPYKAPGPDGFHAGFYQRAWSVVGDDVTDMVKDFVDIGCLRKGMNDTLISLIPKVKNLDSLAFSTYKPV